MTLLYQAKCFKTAGPKMSTLLPPRRGPTTFMASMGLSNNEPRRADEMQLNFNKLCEFTKAELVQSLSC